MSEREWVRLGAASGIAFAILLIIVLLFFPAPPDFDAAPVAVADYYADHRDAIQISNLIGAFAFMFLLWFLGTMRSVLRAAEGGTGRLSGIAFGGGLVAVATFFFAIIITAVAAFRPVETPTAITRVLHDAGFGIAFALGGLAFAVFFAATALLALRFRALIAPLGWLAAVTTVCLILGAFTIFDDSGAFSADGFFGYLPIIAVLAWVLAASIALLARPGTRPVGGVPGVDT